MKHLALLSLFLLNSLTFSQPEPINDTLSITVMDVVPHNDTMWVATAGKGVYKYDLSGNVLEHYTEEDGISSETVLSAIIDSNGNKWFGTVEGITEYNGVKWQKHSPNDSDYIINCIDIDCTGVMWFGTDGNGVLRYDGDTWSKFRKTNSELLADKVYDIGVDVDNSKWFVTLPEMWPYSGEGGVSRYLDDNWEHYYDSSAGGLAYYGPNFMAIEEDCGKWFTKRSPGLDFFNGDTIITDILPDSLNDLLFTFIEIDEMGNKWLGGYDNENQSILIKFNDSMSSVYHMPEGRFYSDLVCISFDSKGKIWLGTRQGISIFTDPSSEIIKDVTQSNHFAKPLISFNRSKSAISITYNLQNPSNVKMRVYSLKGRCVKEINKQGLRGLNRDFINTSDIGSGMFVVKIEAGLSVYNMKLVVGM